MDLNIEFEYKVVEIVRKHLEEHHKIDSSNYLQYQIIGPWVRFRE